ncbi:MAG: peptidylprolyl isomerase [Myxococcota bacterium]
MTASPRVRLITEAGEIEIAVDVARAPGVARYFLDLIEAGHYDGARFYRSTTLGDAGGPRLIQGGPLARWFAPGNEPEPARAPGAEAKARPAMLETFETTAESGLHHVTGTVSLARDLIETGAALPELFICLGAFPTLDFGGRREPDERGFPAFGLVCAGLDVAAAIAARPTAGPSRVARLEGEVLSEPVAIRGVIALRAD